MCSPYIGRVHEVPRFNDWRVVRRTVPPPYCNSSTADRDGYRSKHWSVRVQAAIHSWRSCWRSTLRRVGALSSVSSRCKSRAGLQCPWKHVIGSVHEYSFTVMAGLDPHLQVSAPYPAKTMANMRSVLSHRHGADLYGPSILRSRITIRSRIGTSGGRESEYGPRHGKDQHRAKARFGIPLHFLSVPGAATDRGSESAPPVHVAQFIIKSKICRGVARASGLPRRSCP